MLYQLSYLATREVRPSVNTRAVGKDCNSSMRFRRGKDAAVTDTPRLEKILSASTRQSSRSGGIERKLIAW